MHTSTLTSKNQTTLPKAIVEALHLTPSSKIIYEIDDAGQVILRAKTATFASLAATFPKKSRGKAVPLEILDEGIRSAAVKSLGRRKP